MMLRLIIALILLTSTRGVAEEGGSGHYMPGSISSFADAVPAKPSFITRFNFLYYEGSGSSNPLPFARFVTIGPEAKSVGVGLTLAWRPSLDLGEKWSFAVSATVPYIWMDVTAEISAELTILRNSRFERALRLERKLTDSADGIGDLVVAPVMLNYQFTPDFGMSFRTNIYAPTGDYDADALANVGKNYWSFEPIIGAMYFGQKNGFEATVYAGLTFNTENEDTQYQSGTSFHVDGTIAQHFPLAGGLAGVGVNYFWYEQVTGDSGAGATLGDYEARTAGLGPVLSFTRKIGDTDCIIEAKWLHEVETRNRIKGDYVWVKLLFKF